MRAAWTAGKSGNIHCKWGTLVNDHAILRETLDIIRDRCYILDGRRCRLKLLPEAYQEAIYLSPERVAELRAAPGERTANGILFGNTRGCLRGIEGSPSGYVAQFYQDWLRTQNGQPRGEDSFSWLLDIPELHHPRAPGGTCLSALASGERGSVAFPINNSKGCGGVMRVAPLGLRFGPLSPRQRQDLGKEGAEIAAITHGHSLGYIPAAVLIHIVNLAVYGGCPRGDTLLDAVEDAMDAAQALFGEDGHWPELRALVDRAEALAENDAADVDNIHALGGDWVAEETLAISIYCALRYSDDFSKGVIAAVNHSGDSDSTGAVTGNILGAWLGCGAIEEKWKRNLELRPIILEMADDLCYGCPLSEYSSYEDPQWSSKYAEGKYPFTT